MITNRPSPPQDSRCETTRLIPKRIQIQPHKEKAVDPPWMDPQSVLDFYQVFLTLLLWMLASLACVGILVSVTLLFLVCHPFTHGRKHALTTFHDDRGTA